MKVNDAAKDLPRKVILAAQHSLPYVMTVLIAMVCTFFALMKVKADGRKEDVWTNEYG